MNESLLQQQRNFFALDAEKVLRYVDQALGQSHPGVSCSGHVMALNSLENRVYQVGLESGEFVIAKFYRPGRWSEDQILDEHEFIDRLQELEIPVVPCLSLSESSDLKACASETLVETPEEIFMALFPRVGGRLRDELGREELRLLGRYLGRIHQLSQDWQPEFRLALNHDFYLKDPLERILSSSFLEDNLKARYAQVARPLLEEASRRLQQMKLITVHGDCHLGNVLWENEKAFLLDFDDAMRAPAVQDIWMVVRGRDETARDQRLLLLESYSAFCEFDQSELSGIELLRAIRIIYYSGWIVQRWSDPSFPKAFPLFKDIRYWNAEIESLMEIRDLL